MCDLDPCVCAFVTDCLHGVPDGIHLCGAGEEPHHTARPGVVHCGLCRRTLRGEVQRGEPLFSSQTHPHTVKPKCTGRQ